MSRDSDFYEEDEDVKQVVAVFEAAPNAVTRRVRGVEVSRPSPQWEHGDPERPVRVKVAGVAYQDLSADDAVAVAVQLLHHAQVGWQPRDTELEYGVRASHVFGQLKGDLGEALACASRYHHLYQEADVSVQVRDVSAWRDLTLPQDWPVPRIVTCRTNPAPHVLDEDKDDDGGCADVVDVELPPAVAAAVAERARG